MITKYNQSAIDLSKYFFAKFFRYQLSANFTIRKIPTLAKHVYSSNLNYIVQLYKYIIIKERKKLFY